MHKITLSELLHDLEQEMLRLGYGKVSMGFYRRRWKMLLQFAAEQNEVFYSEGLGIDFLEKKFNILEKNFNDTLTITDSMELRIIRVIGDFQLHHTILRRYHDNKELLTDPYFITIRDRFKSYCIRNDYSKVTVGHYVKQSAQFMDYLASKSIKHCNEINASLLHGYITTFIGSSHHTVGQNIGSMRAFFRFLLEIGEVQIDFSGITPMIRARKQARIPSVWTENELKSLIQAIDRGSPKGKRDYAIILLACCLGIRCTDIKHLKVDDFHWEEKKLIFNQSKTKKTISLPVTPEVGWAVIDYLKYGRPKIDSAYLFLIHRAPFSPFSEENHLADLIKKYMRLAHFPILKKKRGMHSLRHTMASILLEKETPLAIISDILGHTDTDSTAVYLKVDIKKLKECALSFMEENDHD